MREALGSQLFLGRQPILGREQQLLAYELLFRDGSVGAGNSAQIVDPTQATATVIANAFAELSISEVLGAYRAFINIDNELLFSEMIEALPAEFVVLEILENIEPTPEVVTRCQELKALGFHLAVDDIVHAKESHRALFELASVIKVDIFNMPEYRLRSLVTKLKPFGKKLLAEKVESIKEYTLCKKLGFDLFQGYYFAKPTILVGRKLTPSKLVLVRLLTLLMDDAETIDVENTIKLEPALMVNLLRLTNSVGSGLSVKITSLNHAITLLGRKQLQRWIQLLLYTNTDSDQQVINPLMQLAATRGRSMELLCARIHPGQRDLGDQAFMVGIMSLMPTLFGMPMEDILAQLPIAETVKRALLGEDGELTKLLTLVEASEKNNSESIQKARLCFPAISMEELNACFIKAFSWANNLGQGQSAAPKPKLF